MVNGHIGQNSEAQISKDKIYSNHDIPFIFLERDNGTGHKAFHIDLRKFSEIILHYNLMGCISQIIGCFSEF